MPPVFGGGPGGGFVPIIMLVAGDWFAAGRGGGEGFFIVFAPFDWRGGGGFGLFAAASDAFDSGGSEEGDGFTPFIIFDNSSFAVDFKDNAQFGLSHQSTLGNNSHSHDFNSWLRIRF